jgi:hypothetical protein
MMSDPCFVQHPFCTCFTRSEQVGFVCREGGNGLLFSGPLARIAHEIWTRAAQPQTEESLLCDLVEAGFPRLAVETVLQNLRRERALIVAGAAEELLGRILSPLPPVQRPCDHLLVCMTGAIQSAEFNPYLHALRASFCADLKIVLTESARKLVQPKALLHLFSADVYCDVFEEIEDRFVPHIWLSEWASSILVAPASAATLYRLAYATCDDLTSLTVAAAPPETPVIIGPSMNPRMWRNRAVQENVARCRAQGYWVIEPGYAREVSQSWDERSWERGGFGAQPAELIRLMIQILRTHAAGQGPRARAAEAAPPLDPTTEAVDELSPVRGSNDAWNDESPS